MSTSRALASVWTSVTDEDFRSHHLKVCCLWYDELLIETLNNHSEEHFLDHLLDDASKDRRTIYDLTDIVVPLRKRVDKDVLEYPVKRVGIGYPNRSTVKRLNDKAVKAGSRIVSAYKLPDGVKVWIITEADRSATTVLLPDEY